MSAVTKIQALARTAKKAKMDMDRAADNVFRFSKGKAQIKKASAGIAKAERLINEALKLQMQT